MSVVTKYQEDFASFLKENITKNDPKTLYDPMHYILNLGGKRVRPLLIMLSTDVFGADYKQAMYASLAVEIFHNFSLVHDDIMDNASLRRGKPTVHTKWDTNTAILSGDAMLILAYQYFEQYEPHIFRELAIIFSKTALEVCEGQQHDLDFEQLSEVSLTDYLKMIEYKTAVLLGAALKMGGVIAKTSTENKNTIYNFGLHLGTAFQLQDDYLDTFGDDSFGKKIGGDILENKKTFLFLTALQHANNFQKNELLQWYSKTNYNETEKINAVTQLFKDTKADILLKEEIKKYTLKAFSELNLLNIPEEKKNILKEFGFDLMNRKI